jgi:hypothetical protein
VAVVAALHAIPPQQLSDSTRFSARNDNTRTALPLPQYAMSALFMESQEQIMKIIWKSVVLGAAFMGLFVGPASAQERIVANIPFAFEIGHETAPAGKYELVIDGDGILELHGENVNAGAFASTMPADGHDPDGSTPALVFLRGETGYRLSTVWQSDVEGRKLASVALGAHHNKAELDQSEGPATVIRAIAH